MIIFLRKTPILIVLNPTWSTYLPVRIVEFVTWVVPIEISTLGLTNIYDWSRVVFTNILMIPIMGHVKPSQQKIFPLGFWITVELIMN